MPFVNARWIDQNNRSHDWSGDVASNDHNQIKSQIKAQTGAKSVIISKVGSDSSSYDEYRKNHNREENERRRQQESRLTSNYSSNSFNSSYNSSPSKKSSIDFSGNSSSLIGLVGVIGGIWLFFTFMPWIMMLGCGSAGTWIAEKVLGQTTDDYLENQNPTEKQNRNAVLIVLAAILCGGFGFVQGSSWQNSWNTNTTNIQQTH